MEHKAFKKIRFVNKRASSGCKEIFGGAFNGLKERVETSCHLTCSKNTLCVINFSTNIKNTSKYGGFDQAWPVILTCSASAGPDQVLPGSDLRI